MNILFNILASVVASAVIFIGGMNLPASNFSLKSFTDPVFGAFTEISTATNLADFPTTYNANLNKTIEVGTTSVASITTLGGLTTASALVTVGTLTSGSLGSGFTTVVVARGGTGSTTLSSNQVLLGNGTGNIGIVSGYGSSGQFLTSNGSGSAPTWTTSAIDNSLNYNWTGTNLFKNLNASSTVANPIVLNGVSYNTPSTQGASSTVMSNNGSGTLYHVALPWLKVGEALFAGDATTTLTLTSTTTSRDIKIVILGTVSGTNSCRPTLKLNPNTAVGSSTNYSYSYNSGNGAAVSANGVDTILLNTPSGSVANPNIHFDINLTNDASIMKYMKWVGGEHPSAGGAINAQSVGTAVLADTTDQLKSVALGIKCDSGASTITAGRISVYASQN